MAWFPFVSLENPRHTHKDLSETPKHPQIAWTPLASDPANYPGSFSLLEIREG